jgi:hypothetical protein
MLRPLAQYVRDEAKPRWRRVVFSPETYISAIVVAFLGRFGARLFSEFPKVSDITTGLIAYASIALGFCVAGLTISLTLPEPKFTLQLAHREEGQVTSAYSDLLFVFSWTAIAHWVTIVALFAVVLFADGAKALLPQDHSAFRAAAIAAIGGLCAYCFSYFLITLITLSQVGNIYIKFLAAKHKEAERGAEPSR